MSENIEIKEKQLSIELLRHQRIIYMILKILVCSSFPKINH